jgi:hypothetical protein
MQGLRSYFKKLKSETGSCLLQIAIEEFAHFFLKFLGFSTRYFRKILFLGSIDDSSARVDQ